ncbi:hypothetical protein GL213_12130 [Halogeometricum borinquense]|uniref:PKD domain-containing protein n=1 Tax=Halogeometricum borinquense TaxID=60847 RepID=A0A6C0UHU3_9EURY|nr:FG-GAP repeat protein [Halogeometricum borinquense]QIB73389.1 hypothetical protein G3I44_03280 [Halogeometricum borinquense]QIQ77210.1 hypothetical protein GL213_12130 [Halogeometricum borinquense]
MSTDTIRDRRATLARRTFLGAVAGVGALGMGTGGAAAERFERVAILTRNTGDPDEDTFYGLRSALDGNRAFVGAPGGVVDERITGFVDLGIRRSGTWTQQPLIPSPNDSIDLFGYDLDAEDRYLVVSAPFAKVGDVEHAGEVYVYRRSAGQWELRHRLHAPTPRENASFGQAVALSFPRIVVTESPLWLRDPVRDDVRDNPSGAYVFEFGNGEWSFLTELEPDDGTPDDLFGHAVDIEQQRVVVGAPRAENDDHPVGAAFVFRGGKRGWRQTGRLVGADDAPGVGAAVATDRNIVLVGSDQFATGRSSSDVPGSVSVYERRAVPQRRWIVQERLVGPSGEPGDRFGAAIDMLNDHTVIGAPGVGEDGGEAYPYIRRRGRWVRRATLAGTSPTEDKQFGRSVAVDPRFAIVGAPFFPGGSAFIFSV